MNNTIDMSNDDLVSYLLNNPNIPEEAVISYSAGYLQSTLLTLMARFPEVRNEIEWRVDYRRSENGVK